MGKLITFLFQFIPFVRSNWSKLLLLLVCLAGLYLVFRGLLKRKPESTIYVLGESKPDSVFSSPTKKEQSAQTRWDSLKGIQP